MKESLIVLHSVVAYIYSTLYNTTFDLQYHMNIQGKVKGSSAWAKIYCGLNYKCELGKFTTTPLPSL